MSQSPSILTSEAAFHPDQTDAFFAAVPGRWCVALLYDGMGRPLQLVCAKNLRAMLRRRLEAAETTAPAANSKRIDYRELVRHVAWERVDSDFQMDLVYVEAARVAFPAHWRQLIPERSAHFVQIDLNHPHPDFTRQGSIEQGIPTWGPFPDRAKADRWIDAVRDTFDLCRYRHTLAQAPDGRACAYKQMSKCPAPCDGTIPLEIYRDQLQAALDAVRFPEKKKQALVAEMQTHAAALAFEQAAKAKSRLAALEALQAGSFQNVRAVDAFRFVSVQPGPKKGTARIYVASAAGICEAACVTEASCSWEMVRPLCDEASPTTEWPNEVWLGTFCYHLGSGKSSARFALAGEMSSERFAAMLSAAMKPAAASAEEQAVRETRLQV